MLVYIYQQQQQEVTVFHYANIGTCVDIKQSSLWKKRLVYFYQLQQPEVTVFHYVNVDTCVNIKLSSLPKIKLVNFYINCNSLKSQCFIM